MPWRHHYYAAVYFVLFLICCFIYLHFFSFIVFPHGEIVHLKINFYWRVWKSLIKSFKTVNVPFLICPSDDVINPVGLCLNLTM